MPYSVILVDDEPWSMIDITHSLEWPETGFRIVGAYEKPREATQAILENPPDVVFTDIKMPGMDGFELISYCKSHAVKSEFVILSSYSDFCYAQQAIKASVTDYCLKPINPSALRELLHGLAAQLNAKNACDARSQKDDFERILAYIQENYKNKLLLSDISDTFSFHRNYICHLFKKNLNTSFTSYVNTLRIEQAKLLLRNSAMSVEEIAEWLRVDYYYFNKLFKRVTTLTPAAYRKEYALREYP